MSRPPAFPAEQKVRIVLSILAGEILTRNSNILFNVGCVADFLFAEHGRDDVGLLLATV